MIRTVLIIVRLVRLHFGSRASIEAENAVLRQQLGILRRKKPGKLRLTDWDRLAFVLWYRLFPKTLDSIVVVKPETVIGWHRAGFRMVWRWKSRNIGGRPEIDLETRNLIRRISKENPLWGAPRIHGELLKLGIDVCETTVAKYYLSRHLILIVTCDPSFLRVIGKSVGSTLTSCGLFLQSHFHGIFDGREIAQ